MVTRDSRQSRGTKLVSYLYFPFISNKRQVKRGNYHTLISFEDHYLLACDLRLTTSKCLTPIIVESVKFLDVLGRNRSKTRKRECI